MKGLKKIIRSLHQLKREEGVSEILGTVLLLAISVALFSALYLMMQTVLVADHSPTADLVGSIKEDTVFIEHHGGSSLPSSVSISVSIGGTPYEVSFDDSFDENNNGYWDIGEHVSFTKPEIDSSYVVDVSVIDSKSNKAIYLGALKEGTINGSQSTDPGSSSSVISWWHFDEQSGLTAFDSTTNDNDGTISLASWINEGNNLSSLWFNGVNSSIAVERTGHPELDPKQQLTMAAWVKNTDIDDNYLSKIVCRSGGADGYSYALYLNDGVSYDNLGVEIRTETGGIQTREWEWTEMNGSWFHFAASFSNENNGTINLYHNGRNVATWNDIGTNIVYRTEFDNDDVYLGSGPLYSSNYFKGLLDEIILYNKTLSSEEIYQLYLQTAPTVPVNQRAEWRMNENSGLVAFDTSGYNNHGNVYGAEWSVGINESGLNFNGSEYVKTDESNSLNIDGDQLTVEAWVKWKETPSNGDNWANILYKNAESSWGPHYQLQHDQNNEHFEFTISTIEADNAYLWSTTEVKPTVWYYVVGTYDGSEMKLYVNGTLENTKNLQSNFITSTTPVYIGSKSGTERFFNGIIDEVGIYNYVFTPTEIFNRYNQTMENHSVAASLVSYWKLDENSGTTAFDSIGSNDGTVDSATWSTGINNSGLLFDHIRDSLYADSAESLQLTEDFSISLWVNLNTLPNGSEDALFTYTTSGESEIHNTLYEVFIDTAGDLIYKHEYGNGIDETYKFNTADTIVSNSWYHLVLTRDSSTKQVSLYLNNTFIDSFNYTNNPSGGTSSTLYLGSDRPNTKRAIDGYIDEIKLYTGVLSVSEIDILFSEFNSQQSDLISYWKFNENSGTTAFDSVGNNEGTIEGATWADGVNGSGLSFDGDNDYVEVTHSDNLEMSDVNNVSVSMWVNQDEGQSGWIALLQKSDSSYNLHLDNGKTPVFTIFDDDWESANAGITLDSERWYHLVGTFDGSTIKIYVNGSLLGTSSASKINEASSFNIGIGRNLEKSGRYFDGKIDEIKIFNKALSLAEIQILYNETKPFEQNNLISEWEFNENTGSTAYDSTNDNDGTIIDATWTTGLNGSCLSFDGDHDYVTVPDDNSLDLSTSGTIEAWVNVSTHKYYAGIVHKGEKADFSDEAYTLQFWNQPGLIRFALFNEVGEMEYVDSSTQLNEDEWYHIVGTWNETSVSLYLNGELDTSVVNTIGSVRDTVGNVQIGAQLTEDYSGYYGVFGFDGIIDNVKLHRRSLTAEEINQSYLLHSPKEGLDQQNMIAQWKLNENSGVTAFDSVGSNHGSIQGPTWDTGKSESALSFDGMQTEYVSVPFDTSLSLNHDYSVSFWIYPTDNTVQWRTFLTRPDQFTCSYIGNDKIRVHVSGYANIDSTVSAPRNTWTHVVFTYENTDAGDDKIVLYVNGEKDGQVGPTWGTPNNPSNALLMGGDATSSYYTGKLDEILLYDTVLSTEQVNSIYNHYE